MGTLVELVVRAREAAMETDPRVLDLIVLGVLEELASEVERLTVAVAELEATAGRQ